MLKPKSAQEEIEQINAELASPRNRRNRAVFVRVCGMQLTIRTPTDFNFYRTVLTHGWCELLPFELDRDRWKLTRVLDLDRGRPVTVEVSARKGALKIFTSRQVNDRAVPKIVRDVRHMFRLD